MSDLLNATARELAEPQDVSFQKSLYNGTFAGVHTVKLGLMLAQVAIHVNPKASAVSIYGFGDEPTLRATNATVSGGTLTISAPLPYAAEDSGTRPRPHGGSNRFSGVFHGPVVGKRSVVSGGNIGMVVTGDGISIGGSSIVVGGGISVINGILYHDGREVDMTRKILLVLTVPSETSVKVKDTFGNIGLGGELQGDLGLNLSGESSVYAESVRSLRTNLSGRVGVELGIVHGRSKFDMSGSGVVQAQQLKGDINVDISGSGQVVVGDPESTTSSAEIDISGSAQFRHYGTVTGDVEFDISGSGYVEIFRALGDVDDSISGSGSARINDRNYRSRW